jgi:predicted DCC family thiol-disulfide oxidoreductase YuxK
MDRPALPLTVFYDGGCAVCAREMAHYRRKGREGRLRFVDISDPQFDAAPYGRSRADFMAQMHALDAAGRFFRGVDAFPAIWTTFPERRYRLLAALLGLRGLHGLAACGYRLFARLRRFLPRRPTTCSGGSCHLHPPR